MKQFYFLCGLPRTGSTVLTSLLSQNPAIYASPNSCLVELLVNVRNHLAKTEQAQAFLQPTQTRDILIGIMEGAYRFTDAETILDKSRAWPHPKNIKLLNTILPQPAKFIAMVRDLPSILASFITIIEANKHHSVSYVDKILLNENKPITNENRCRVLFSPRGTIYESWHSLQLGYEAGYADNILTIEYDDFTAKPAATLAAMYQFLGLKHFEHDFSNIVNPTPEDDTVYQIPGLHKVRPQLAKTSPDPREVLGDALFAHYSQIDHFWRKTPPTKTTATSSQNPFTLRSRIQT